MSRFGKTKGQGVVFVDSQSSSRAGQRPSADAHNVALRVRVHASKGPQVRISWRRVTNGGAIAGIILVSAALAVAVPASGAQSDWGASVTGSEPWTDSDCVGDIAVVAASDSRAQPDLYSAVTLAAALGTDCVILAGRRERPVSAAQQARLAATTGDVYVVGGTAAVPDSKLAGRNFVRVSGLDRWHTAAAVGTRAAGIPDSTGAADDGHADWPQRIELSGAGDAVEHVTLRPGRWLTQVNLTDNHDDYGDLPASIEIYAPDSLPCWRPLADRIIRNIGFYIHLNVVADAETHERAVCRAGRFAVRIDTGGPLHDVGSWHVTFTER